MAACTIKNIIDCTIQLVDYRLLLYSIDKLHKTRGSVSTLLGEVLPILKYSAILKILPSVTDSMILREVADLARELLDNVLESEVSKL